MVFEGDHNIKFKAAKNLLKIIILLAITLISFKSQAEEKKDCKYCNKYELMGDWPVSERPKEFIYVEINYPDGMFKRKIDKTEKVMLARKFMRDL